MRIRLLAVISVNRMRIRLLAVISLAFALACRSAGVSKQMDAIVSWLGTAGMTGEAWLRRTTPDAYTRRTLELSHDSLLELRGALFKSLPAGIDSAALAGALGRSGGQIALMARLVEEKNSPGVRRQLDSLYAEKKLIEQLADGIERRER